jgi:hypothetical protein
MKAIAVVIALTAFFDRSSEQLLETNNVTVSNSSVSTDSSTNDGLSKDLLYVSNESSVVHSRNDSSSIDNSLSVTKVNQSDTSSNRPYMTDVKSFYDQAFSPNVTSKDGSSTILSSTSLTESLLKNSVDLNNTSTKTNISEGSDISANDSSQTISDILTSNNKTEDSDSNLIKDSSLNDTLPNQNITQETDILRESEAPDILTNKTLSTDISFETKLSDNSMNLISSTDISFDDVYQTLLSVNNSDNVLSSENSLNETLKNQTLGPFETPALNSTSLLDDVPTENGFEF